MYNVYKIDHVTHVCCILIKNMHLLHPPLFISIIQTVILPTPYKLDGCFKLYV